MGKRLCNFHGQDHHHTPRVAMLPCLGMGHLIPHLELAKRLCNFHGLQVTLFVYSTKAFAAQSQCLLSNSLPKSLQIYHHPPKNIAPSIENSSSLEIRLSTIIRESLPEFESCIVNSHDIKDTVVSHINGFDITNKVNIPKYIYFCPAAYIFSLMMYLPTLDKQVQEEFIDLKNPIQTPGCKPIQPNDLHDPLWDRKTGAYKWFLNHTSRFLIKYECQDFDPNTIQSFRDNSCIYPVGPLVKPQLAKLNDEYLTWLNQQPKDYVIYVSFGNDGSLLRQTTELAWGLEMSKKRFIWVVRKPVEKDASATFFNVGNEENNPDRYLPHGFQRRVNGIGLVIPSWAPQVELFFCFEACILLKEISLQFFVSMGEIWLTLIAWSLYAEQRSNAAVLEEEIGIAIRVKVMTENGVLGREEIERLVRLIMEEGNNDGSGFSLRRKAKELQILVTKAVGEDGLFI
ncbi:hypothetical protein MKX03_014113 [Papaver bracteatum]|nr:hypothetical protein MKX03_014113 [Papaver bracteatum]